MYSMSQSGNLQELQIRDAREQDISDVAALEKSCFDTYYYRNHRFSELQLTDYLRSKRAIFLVATRKTTLIGYIAGLIRGSGSELSVRVETIAVSPGLREKGVGSRLLRRFIHDGKLRGCKSIALQVATANKSGIHFFAKLGFRKIRRLPAYYGKGVDGILMKLGT